MVRRVHTTTRESQHKRAMNYLAHGFRHLDDPWFVAGTALPDWLRVLDRRARAPAETVAAHAHDPDPRVASLARGVLRHHEDDRRFHGSSDFAAARAETSRALRTVLPAADGHRPSFISHLLVEIHLDDVIAGDEPGLLDRYYAALGALDPSEVGEVAQRVAPGAPAGLPRLVRRFLDDRFLADYAQPRPLLRRLDRVLGAARQPGLPASVEALIPLTRASVASRRNGLLGESREPAPAPARYPG